MHAESTFCAKGHRRACRRDWTSESPSHKLSHHTQRCAWSQDLTLLLCLVNDSAFQQGSPPNHQRMASRDLWYCGCHCHCLCQAWHHCQTPTRTHHAAINCLALEFQLNYWLRIVATPHLSCLLYWINREEWKEAYDQSS